MIEAAHKGEMGLLYSIGGNLLETMPDRKFVASALAQAPVRIHQDIVLNSSMLIDPEELVILLPAQTRYEQRTGGTTTSTERRIRFTPEIPGHRIGETCPEWEIPCLIGRKAMPNGDRLFPYEDTQSIREEMSRVMPMYQGVEKLTKEGDSLQWGGPYLFKGGNFSNMPEGRALFSALAPPDRRVPEGRFYLATRRGKQFNSMTFSSADRLMGSKTREAIFISPEDAERLGPGAGSLSSRRDGRSYSNRAGKARHSPGLLARGQRPDFTPHRSPLRRAGLQCGGGAGENLGPGELYLRAAIMELCRPLVRRVDS
jgi:predicted molibdopterin-dependent oxidoreductase YjgC